MTRLENVLEGKRLRKVDEKVSPLKERGEEQSKAQ